MVNYQKSVHVALRRQRGSICRGEYVHKKQRHTCTTVTIPGFHAVLSTQVAGKFMLIFNRVLIKLFGLVFMLFIFRKLIKVYYLYTHCFKINLSAWLKRVNAHPIFFLE